MSVFSHRSAGQLLQAARIAQLVNGADPVQGTLFYEGVLEQINGAITLAEAAVADLRAECDRLRVS